MKEGDKVAWTYPPGENIDEVTGLIIDSPKTERGTVISINTWTHVPNRTEKTIKIRRPDGEIRYICDADAEYFNLRLCDDSISSKV